VPKQTIAEKATQYIVDGKISVRAVDLDMRHAHIQAAGTRPQPYNVHFTEGGWTCDCPAIVNGHTECAHINAAKRLVPDLRPVAKPKIGQNDVDLDDFLSALCPSTTNGKPGEDFSLDEL
jgi:hypothetical protein